MLSIILFVFVWAVTARAEGLRPAPKLRSSSLYSYTLSGQRVYTAVPRTSRVLVTSPKPVQKTVIVSRCRGGVCRR